MEHQVKLRLDVISKPKLARLFFIIVIICLGIAVSSLFVPNMFSSDSNRVYVKSTSPNQHTFDKIAGVNIFNGRLQGINLKNQLIFLLVTPVYEKNVNTTCRVQIEIKTDTNIVKVSQQENFEFTCNKGDCQSKILFYDPYIESELYHVQLAFLDGLKMNAMDFTLGFINQQFTVFQLVLKYTCLIVAIAVFVYYSYVLRTLRSFEIDFEQKIVWCLCLSLILFNEPFIALTIFMPSQFYSIASMFCVSQFGFAIILVWMLVFTQYAFPFKKKLLYIYESILVIACYGILLTIYGSIHLKIRKNPVHNWSKDILENYREVTLCLGVLILLLLITLGVLVCRAIPLLKQLSLRRKFMAGYNLAAIVLIFIGLQVGAFQPMPRTGSILVIFMSLLNLYVYLLAFLYSPSRRSLIQYCELKKIEEKTIDHYCDTTNFELEQQQGIKTISEYYADSY